MKILNPHRWSALVASALLVIGAVGTTTAFAQSEEDDEEDSAELDRVVITGSRISRTAIEGPSPVTVIDREQIDREGFTTVAEALKSLNQVTGLSQNEAQAGTFTQNANTINLRNLGTNQTLILVDGYRLADYPLPYNSQSNIVNISAIPLAAVERIEYLASGASAIYGSDAVAGVVNIILRDDIANSLDLSVRYGDFVDGGGENVRVQGVGGFLGDNWNVTYAFEYFDRDPIFASQRDFMDSTFDSPIESGRINSRNAVELDLIAEVFGTGPWYVDPRAAVADPCGSFSDLELSSRPNPDGGDRFYCGTDDWIGEASILNEREQINFYTAGTIEFASFELFGAVNYFQTDANIDVGNTFYTSLDDDFFAEYYFVPNSPSTAFGPPGTGTISRIQRLFTNAEVPPEVRFAKFDEEVIDYRVGIRGQLFSPYWDYELVYTSSDYELERERSLWVDERIDNYFYDIQEGVVGPFGFPVANIRYENLYSPISPEIWNQLSEIDRTDAESSKEAVIATITGDLLDLPAGTLGFAGVLEYGSQDYDISLDPRLVSGDYFWGFTGSGGGGERDRYAAGVELSIPVLDTLQFAVAGRYDRYDDITDVDGAFTYNIGIEYRPTDRILLRASRATSFRAPDMHFVFANPSGFFVGADDIWRCEAEQPGVPLSECDFSDIGIFGEREGDPALQEEEGESLTVGFVVEPIDNLTLTADYWEVELENIVLDRPIQDILQLEAECRLGREDINSGECQDALSRVIRNPPDDPLEPNELIQVNTTPINAGFNKVYGVDARLEYAIETDGAGTFTLNLGWTHTLGDDFKVLPDDPVENVRDDSINWRSRIRGSLGWSYGDFRATLFGERFGSTLSWDAREASADEVVEEPRMGPQMYYNLTAGYTFLDGKADISLIVNNLFDEEPPVDQNWSDWPYFSFFNYYQFALGQSWALQVDYRFDY